MKQSYILVAILILITGIYFTQFKRKSNLGTQETENTQIITPSPTITPTFNNENWKEYKNVDLGITFKVPENFEVEKSGKYSIIAGNKTNDQEEGMPRFFYLSIIPDSYNETDVEVIYNYNEPDMEKFLDTEINERITLTENKQIEEWFSYERINNVNIGDKTAKVFVNNKPWNFPTGTEERRFIFELNGKKVIAGGYIDGPQANGVLPLHDFEEIINSLEIN